MKFSEILWIADLMRLVLGKNITFLRRTFQYTHPTQRNHELETCSVLHQPFKCCFENYWIQYFSQKSRNLKLPKTALKFSFIHEQLIGTKKYLFLCMSNCMFRHLQPKAKIFTWSHCGKSPRNTREIYPISLTHAYTLNET